VVLAALLATMLAPASAPGAVLSSSNGAIYFVANQGERNDTLIGTDRFFGERVYTFKDADVNPVTIGPGFCALVNGVAMCTASGISSIFVNVRDRDDTLQVATAGEAGEAPPSIPTTLIGGRGVDVIMGGVGPDILKGNNSRDSLRGRLGADVYKGGRGSDTLQTLDGGADAFISCGTGARDLVRADKVDPRPKSCELGGRKPAKRF
jgi:Ca2+-binding RTX toxin-like protein